MPRSRTRTPKKTATKTRSAAHKRSVQTLIRKLEATGLSKEEIASHLRCGVRSVYRWAAGYGVLGLYEQALRDMLHARATR